MATRNEYLDLLNQIASLRVRLAERQATERPGEAALADRIAREIGEVQEKVLAHLHDGSAPADFGQAELLGLGSEAKSDLGAVRTGLEVAPYDENVTSERILGIADLYYQYQFERIGVFRAVLKLQELFKAGQVRLSSGEGAVGLYRFDRKKTLRYTRKERLQAYKRVFGYTSVAPPTGARANRTFHGLFTQFNTQVGRFFRDKQISEVVRHKGAGVGFGSVARVRRAGLDLRSNLKQASYGHVNVMTVEVSQLLEFAFRVLGAEDVRNLFGADSAWDVLEEILARYLKEESHASQRSRMAVAGRDILRWLAQSDVLTLSRSDFESLVMTANIGELAEEWLTSAESLAVGGRAKARSLPSNVVRMRRRQSA
jgi:hypothetical protein